MNGDKQSIWRELQGLRQYLVTRTLRKILYMILFQPRREVYSTSKRKITKSLCSSQIFCSSVHSFFLCYIRENVSSTSKEKSLHVSSRSLSFSSQQTLFLNCPPFLVSSTSPSRPSHSWSTPMSSNILTSFKNSIHLPIATPLLCSLS